MNRDSALGARRNTLIDEMLAYDPGIPHRTAARLLAAEHPDLFTSVEVARTALRARTGNRGHNSRRTMERAHGHQFREPGTGNALPVPTPFWDSSPVVFDTERCLIIGDVHIPFHAPDAIKIAAKEAKRRGCRDVLIDGDLLDMYQESDFCRVPDVATLTQELADGRQFLQWLRKQFPKGRLLWKEGNHEERFTSKVYRALPEAGRLLDGFTFAALGCSELGIETVSDRRRVDMGYLTVLHGHELGRGAYNPVSAARNLQLRAKEIALVAHWHQPSAHSVRTLRQHYISTWSIGCLCHLAPRYAPVNDWRHGFAIYERITSDGGFTIDNRSIIGGRVV